MSTNEKGKKGKEKGGKDDKGANNVAAKKIKAPNGIDGTGGTSSKKGKCNL